MHHVTGTELPAGGSIQGAAFETFCAQVGVKSPKIKMVKTLQTRERDQEDDGQILKADWR